MSTHCPRCGGPASGDHALCQDAIALEPPRYCVMCGRRMRVQVLPAGWRAECVEQGVASGGNAPFQR